MSTLVWDYNGCSESEEVLLKGVSHNPIGAERLQNARSDQRHQPSPEASRYPLLIPVDKPTKAHCRRRMKKSKASVGRQVNRGKK